MMRYYQLWVVQSVIDRRIIGLLGLIDNKC